MFWKTSGKAIFTRTSRRYMKSLLYSRNISSICLMKKCETPLACLYNKPLAREHSLDSFSTAHSLDVLLWTNVLYLRSRFLELAPNEQYLRNLSVVFVLSDVTVNSPRICWTILDPKTYSPSLKRVFQATCRILDQCHGWRMSLTYKVKLTRNALWGKESQGGL